MNTISQKTINYTFKMLYVIAIFMIIDGHIGSLDYLNFHDFMPYQNFHIALFTFTSGYFLNLTYNYKEFIKRKFMNLILPLYIWNIIYGLICYYLNNYQGFNIGEKLNLYNLFYAPIIDGHQYIYNMASWFIVPLFLVQIISFLLLKPFDKKNKNTINFISTIFFIVSLIIGCIILHLAANNHGERNINLLFYRTIYFLPSFSFGYLYKNIIEKYDTLPSIIFLPIILGIYTIIYYYFPNTRHIPSWLNYLSAPSIIIYAISLICILFWLRIAKILTPIIINSKTLQYISNNTYSIMMHHFIGFMIVKYLVSNTAQFNEYKFKHDIWYYHFPLPEATFSWLYIFITLVIILFIRFTTFKIYDILKQMYRGNFYEN